MAHGPDPIFREEQPFREATGSAVFAVLALLLGIVLPAALLLAGLPLRPVVLAAIVPVVMLAAAVLLLRCLTLVTEVHDSGLTVSLRPVPRARWAIPLTVLASHQAEEYDPKREFRGWGVMRLCGGKRCFTVRGTRGVRLVYASGKQTVIGSQRAEELNRALSKALREGDRDEPRRDNLPMGRIV